MSSLDAADAQAFQDVGTSEPVNLTPEQKDDVVTVLESMGAELPGGDDLPDDLFELRNALRIDSATTGESASWPSAPSTRLREAVIG